MNDIIPLGRKVSTDQIELNVSSARIAASRPQLANADDPHSYCTLNVTVAFR